MVSSSGTGQLLTRLSILAKRTAKIARAWTTFAVLLAVSQVVTYIVGQVVMNMNPAPVAWFIGYGIHPCEPGAPTIKVPTDVQLPDGTLADQACVYALQIHGWESMRDTWVQTDAQLTIFVTCLAFVVLMSLFMRASPLLRRLGVRLIAWIRSALYQLLLRFA